MNFADMPLIPLRGEGVKETAAICRTVPQPKNGAADRIRTYDPRITNAVLYRLSYCGVKCASLIPGAGRIGKQEGGAGQRRNSAQRLRPAGLA